MEVIRDVKYIYDHYLGFVDNYNDADIFDSGYRVVRYGKSDAFCHILYIVTGTIIQLILVRNILGFNSEGNLWTDNFGCLW